MSVQETTQTLRSTYADALVQGESRGAQLVADNAALEMDRQLREQITPRLDEIVQYVSSTAAAVERAERAMTNHAREGGSGSNSGGGDGGGGSTRGGGGGDVHGSSPVHISSMALSRASSVHGSEPPRHLPTVLSRAGSVHGSEEANMAMEDAQRGICIGEAAASVSASSVLSTVDDGQHPEILDMLTGINTDIKTILRVVVEGEVPDSVPKLGDPGPGHATTPTPEEIEAVARMEAMRREMVSFPDQLQQVSEKMEELRLALEKNVSVPNNNEEEEEEQVPVALVPDILDKEVVARNRALEEEKVTKSRAFQEEEARWKESIEGSHSKHHGLIEQLSEKIDGSSHTSKLAMKTFWGKQRIFLFEWEL